jgi:hypothetical protein
MNAVIIEDRIIEFNPRYFRLIILRKKAHWCEPDKSRN